jgi:ATP-dependent Clp protease ATP-binding subunit ClpA
VFNALDRQAMDGICRKLVAEMQKLWISKRGKQLEVPEELLQFLGERAHHLNEKSQGKEGGRIIHKLISELVEAKIQQEITLRTKEYRDCSTVVLAFTAATQKPDEAPAPEVAVQFR